VSREAIETAARFGWFGAATLAGMPTTSRTPAALAAGLVTAALWVGAAILSGWADRAVGGPAVRTLLPHPNGTVPAGSPISGQALLAAALTGLVVMVAARIATRRLPSRSGTWAAFLATWCAVVGGGAMASVADTLADIAFPAPMNPSFHLLAAAFAGAWWGLLTGWVAGLVLVGVLSVSGRGAAETLPATRRARKPLRVRSWPTVLCAGLAASAVWATTGAAGSWLVWHRNARGAIDLVGEVAPGAMIWRFAPQAPSVDIVEVVLAGGIGLVVAGCAWLATRRLPPRAGRWTLALAVWFSVVFAAVSAAVVRSLVSYSADVLHATALDLVLPAAQAATFWPLATGWCAGLLAALVDARTGGRATEPAPPGSADRTPPQEGAQPSAAEARTSAVRVADHPRSAVHTDAEERSLIT
jgi:hypothetical protein